MRYVMRTVSWKPERLANVETIKQQIPELEVIVDQKPDWYASFLLACEMMHETGGVLLEDDIFLCRNFKTRIEGVIGEKGSDTVINFFERPKIDLDTALVGGSKFMWTQCTYFPPGFMGKCVTYYEQFKSERPKKWYGLSYDCLVSYVLVKEKMKYWRIRPCLVQHLPFVSTSSHPAGRQTPFFIDDIEDACVQN